MCGWRDAAGKPAQDSAGTEGRSNEDHCYFWTGHRCSDHGSLCICFADLRFCKGITFLCRVIVNTKSAFRIAYKESNRGYSDTLELQGCVSDAAATRERCFCGSSRSRHRRRSTSRTRTVCWI